MHDKIIAMHSQSHARNNMPSSNIYSGGSQPGGDGIPRRRNFSVSWELEPHIGILKLLEY